jgi:tetratricopeptide (TPR) repeat protein
LRVTRRAPAAPKATQAKPSTREHPARRRRRRQTEAIDELGRIAGPKRTKAIDQLGRAAALFAAGRERDALRIVRPLAESYPDAAGVQELLGLCHYRVGQFPTARKALERFAELSNSTEQHPVLMDCVRAVGKHQRVETLWAELAQASPSAELVTEGRIVMAGSLADRGKLAQAIDLLEKRALAPKRVQDHHLRLWYALGDLHDRAGNSPAARRWFDAVAQRDRRFADVAERLAALGR